MKNLKDIILEKLKVSKKTLSDAENTIEVPYYEFVMWYTGSSYKKPDDITEWDFRISDFIESIVDSNGNKVFINCKLAENFYKEHKDEIVTVTIEKQRGPAGDDGVFLHIIDFGDTVFYANAFEDFVNYIQYCRETADK